jgi:predicted O-methyltransferase YrrM
MVSPASKKIAEKKSGPIFDIARPILDSSASYKAFQDGGSRAEFGRFLDTISPQLVAAGLPPEDVHFAKRYPRCPVRFVDDALAELVARGIVPGVTYDRDWYEELIARMAVNYGHGTFQTYIYPEEARLLFALAEILRPKAAIFLGSYYGYWAHAALAAIISHGGRAVLVDPDPLAQAVAQSNINAAGLSTVEVAVTTGENYSDTVAGTYDFVVLDAEGRRDHPDPEQRGKRIYAPLLRHVLPRLAKNAWLVCHNILLQDIAECPYFDAIIQRNNAELGDFLTLANSEFPLFFECSSTEGVGLWSR